MSDTQYSELGSLADVQTGPFGSQLHSSDYVAEGTPIITVEHLIGENGISHENIPLVSASDRTRLIRYSLQTGDLVFSRVGAIDRCSYVSPSEDGWLFSGRLLRVRPDRSRVDSRFLASYLSHEPSQRWIRDHAVGSTMPCLNTSILKQVPLSLPPLPTQRTIAEILNTTDKAIRSTERLIAKLEQAKQGLLHDLLTHDGRTAPLGVTPGPWSIVHLRDLYIEPPRNGLYKPPRFHGSGAPMVQMGQLFRGLSLDASDAPRVQVSASELARFGLAHGDLLFGRRSLVLEGAGKCTVVDYVAEPMTFESSLIRVRIDSSRLNPSFAALILSTPEAARDRMQYVRQVAVSGVTSDDVGNFRIPIPPIVEQRRIEEIWRTQQSRIEIAREEAAKLRRVKHGLMGDLLIGRMRVGAEEGASA